MKHTYFGLAIVVTALFAAVVYVRIPKGTSMNNQQAQPTAQPIDNPKPPEMQIDTAKKYTATLETTEGKIIIALSAKETPKTVNNFVYLSRKGFYDKTPFHRVIKGFMIQGGDPRGNGTGGPGYKFEDEPFTGIYTRGIVAMANSGPDTNGSQFFIMHKDTSLPHAYTIFGRVISGMEVVDAIAAEKVNSNNRPLVDVVMTIVEVVE